MAEETSMRLFSWLRFLKPLKVSAPEAEVSRKVALRIAQNADTVQRRLKVYQRARDPFAAMMADVYNRDQLSRTYLNGHG